MSIDNPFTDEVINKIKITFAKKNLQIKDIGKMESQTLRKSSAVCFGLLPEIFFGYQGVTKGHLKCVGK